MARLLLQSQIADALAPVSPPSPWPGGDQQQPALMIVQQQQPAATSWRLGDPGRWVLYMGISLCGVVSLIIMSIVCRYRWRSARALELGSAATSGSSRPAAGAGSAAGPARPRGPRPLVVIQPDRSVVFGVADDASKAAAAAFDSAGGDSGGKDDGGPVAAFSMEVPAVASVPRGAG